MTPSSSLLQHFKYAPIHAFILYDGPQDSIKVPSVPPAPAAQQIVTKAPSATNARTRKKGRPRIVHTNELKRYLQQFSSPGHALAKLPHLGDIATGAVSLDYGKNARPLGIKTSLVLLRRLDIISTESILDYMQLSLRPCSKRHAQRLAQCLRIIERAARAVRSEWLEPGHVDEADSYATLHRLVPCCEQGCSICTPVQSVEQAWDLVATMQDDATDSFEVDFEASNADDWADLEDDLIASG